MSDGKPYTIGSLARAAGVGIQTVRFYERKGLLAQPPRSGPAYRQYSADRKTAEIDAKIRDLHRMKRSLEELSKACTVGKRAVTQCRIVECFTDCSEC